MDMAARSGGAEPMLTLEQDNLKEATQKPKEEQKPPQWYYTSGVIKHFASMLAIRKYLSKELIKNIERSADKLYYHCANHYDFATLHKEFGLPDNFFAWYRLTLLHVWMMLTRLQQSMEIYAYCVYRRHLITALHTDMAERYRLIFSKNKYATLKRHSKYKELYNGVFMSSMFEYDEGFLCDDKVFAGAVWRSLFVQDPNLDIIHLNKAVRYIRETMHFLDGLDANQLLNDGLDRWAPADKISEEQKQRTQQL